MIDGGLRARLTCVDTRVLDASFVGRDVRRGAARRSAGEHVDPCGENGEFHTCVYAGPMFHAPLDCSMSGELVTREPFVWADSHGHATSACGGQCHEQLPLAHRLPDRGDDRDALPARRGRPRRRRLGLHGPAAGGAPEAARVGVHSRALREDRGAQAGPRPRLLRSAGGHRRRARSARPPGRGLQPAQRRRNPADDPDARRAGRRADRADALASRLEAGLDDVRDAAARLPRRPRVFFEEWDDPLSRASAGWRNSSRSPAASRSSPSCATPSSARTASSAGDEVVAPRPGRDRRVVVRQAGPAREDPVAARMGAGAAVRNRHVYEVKSAYILQPGPASLTEGVQQLHAILARVAERT